MTGNFTTIKRIIMKSLSIISFLIVFGHFAFAQPATNTQVKICDASTKLPIPYATVKSVAARAGTYSNEAGVFMLLEAFGDTLLISSIGYSQKIIAVSAIQNDTIFLLPYFREMKTISIEKRNKIRLDTLGIRNVPTLLSYGSERYTFEMAQKILLRKERDQKEYELRKVMIAASRFAKTVPVLLHIYSMGPDGFPDQDLLRKKTLLRKQDFNKKRKEFIIDLQNEHILLTDSVCFVSLEWLPVDTVAVISKPVIGLRLTDAISEYFTYAKGLFVQKANDIDIRDDNWMIFSMIFPPLTPWLKREQVYGTNTIISIEVAVLE
jgi:hypothetical protein